MSHVAPPLPISPWIPEILARVRERRAVVVTAAPGTGKTTQVPPALAADGPVILLQPRRVAARSIAARIAAEQGWTLGREVGWHVRFERRFARDSRLIVATEGILTARLQQDPLLSAFRTIVLDEFHERSIHADLGIALARQAWLARDDLQLVVMSATLDTTRVAAWLGDCPVVAVPGEIFPLQILYRPDTDHRQRRRRGARRHPGSGAVFPRRRTGDCAGAAGGHASVAWRGRRPAPWRAAGVRTRRGDRRHEPAADHPLDQHRRDLAHRPGRARGRGQRLPQSGPLRFRTARSTAWRPRELPLTPRINARGAPLASGQEWPCGSGIRASGCSRIGSRRSTGLIYPARCSTSSLGAAIHGLSSGSNRRQARRSRRVLSSSSGWVPSRAGS